MIVKKVVFNTRIVRESTVHNYTRCCSLTPTPGAKPDEKQMILLVSNLITTDLVLISFSLLKHFMKLPVKISWCNKQSFGLTKYSIRERTSCSTSLNKHVMIIETPFKIGWRSKV